MFTDITDIVCSLRDEVAPVLEQMEWAEEEIAAAIKRHPAKANDLYHSFTLLRPETDTMTTEFVYRGHCRELLERVVRGEDTRPGTAAEVVLTISDVSLATPLKPEAVGLMLRMFREAFPDKAFDDDDQEHREALYRSRIDDAEQMTRTKLAVTERHLGVIECGGLHHGEAVRCKYAQKQEKSA